MRNQFLNAERGQAYTLSCGQGNSSKYCSPKNSIGVVPCYTQNPANVVASDMEEQGMDLTIGAPFWTIEISSESSRLIVVKITVKHGEAP